METCEFCKRKFVVAEEIWFGYSYEDEHSSKALTGKWTVDPFAREVYDDVTEHWICRECFSNGMWEI